MARVIIIRGALDANSTTTTMIIDSPRLFSRENLLLYPEGEKHEGENMTKKNLPLTFKHLGLGPIHLLLLQNILSFLSFLNEYPFTHSYVASKYLLNGSSSFLFLCEKQTKKLKLILTVVSDVIQKDF